MTYEYVGKAEQAHTFHKLVGFTNSTQFNGFAPKTLTVESVERVLTVEGNYRVRTKFRTGKYDDWLQADFSVYDFGKVV